MENLEMVYQSEALTNGYAGIDSHRNWWLDTSEQYSKIYSLDKKGIPIVWDDETYSVDEIRQCTKNDTCTIILFDKNKKVLVLVHKDLDNVLIQGAVNQEVSWDDYAKFGLWAVKKNCPTFKLEAVVFNPNIKTLEKFKVVKAIIKKVIETRDLTKGKDHAASKKDKED